MDFFLLREVKSWTSPNQGFIGIKPRGDSRVESKFSGVNTLLTVEEAARMTSLSRAKVFDLISKGEFPSVKIGGSRRIPVDQLNSWIDQLCKVQSGRGQN